MALMPKTTVTSKGQVTIPLVVREHLSVYPGDQVDFEIEDGGVVRVRKVGGSPMDLVGILARPGEPAVSLEEMEQAIRRGGGKVRGEDTE
jgi:AbrB family looped-hinge helix DNA binding protein